jgi:hypothetical protein
VFEMPFQCVRIMWFSHPQSGQVRYPVYGVPEAAARDVIAVMKTYDFKFEPEASSSLAHCGKGRL